MGEHATPLNEGRNWSIWVHVVVDRKTCAEEGKRYGISPTRISQIVRKHLRMIRYRNPTFLAWSIKEARELVRGKNANG